MIVSSRSTLQISSDSLTVAEMTSVLGIAPHHSHEKGDATRSALAGRKLEAEYMTYPSALWSFEADESAVDPDDHTGFGSLRVLVEAFSGRLGALNSLKQSCKLAISWAGESDSSQGGFVIPADLLADLAAMGCDLYGTAYIDDKGGDDTDV